jgi:hypothetical protein
MGSVGDAIERQNKYVYIDAASTTLVKTGEGVLIRVVHTSNVSGAISTFYDNTSASGPVLHTRDLTGPGIGSDELNIPFKIGLTVVVSAADSITVVYR